MPTALRQIHTDDARLRLILHPLNRAQATVPVINYFEHVGPVNHGSMPPVLFANLNVLDGVKEALIENANVVVTKPVSDVLLDRREFAPMEIGSKTSWHVHDTKSV